ncbi:NADH-cytochrome b-5 reductase [Stipitochalara longipes BDJ]|nr:NADH-cytochrome b-5 reductase [Stipitochalara longipes BDJ]
MSAKTTKQSLSHLERTAAEPRDENLHRVTLTHITRVNSTIRLFRISPTLEPGRKPITFLPGQWLDVHVPGIYKAGGFTITSPPSLLRSPTNYLELAIQKSPSNPPAAWLWQDEEIIIEKELQVRVGGSFVWPPPLPGKEIKRVVFVAGGVGINPLMSIVSHLEQKKRDAGSLGFVVKFLYTTRDLGLNSKPSKVLFLQRLISVFESLGREGNFELFWTSGKQDEEKGGSPSFAVGGKEIEFRRRRIHDTDILDALGPSEEREGTVCYICGVPTMTDDFVQRVKTAEGMKEANVLSEKWW